MASAEINEFLCGPLVTWFISCLEDPNALTNYEDLIDGVLLHNVFLQIDPEPLYDGVTPSGGDSRVRMKNLETVVDNMKQFYEEQLGHLLLVVPDTYKLGKDPERHVAEAKLLLLLLLGCAVQCSNKEDFITRIKTLNVDTQLAIVDCIKQVTDYQDIVVSEESMESANLGNVFARMKKLLQERSVYRSKLKSLQVSSSDGDEDGTSNGDDRSEESILLGVAQDAPAAERADVTSKKGAASKLDRLFSPGCGEAAGTSSREEVHRYAVELADWKSKVRKQRQELEEKTEALIECREEVEHSKTLLVKLREENQELLLEARTAKSYRDELDAAIERAEKADRLEAEVARYREKLTDIDYYKSRIEELREDNRVLMETREMLEEQLSSSRKRSEQVHELESEIIKYEQLLNSMALERVADKDKYQEVCEENAKLQRLIKSVASEVVASGAVSGGGGGGGTASDDNRLSEQLSNNAQARALKLELENRRLASLVDSLKEQSFHESSSRLLELEKEKKKLSLKVDSLSDKGERLSRQNQDLELVCKQTLEENEKLQACLASQRGGLDRQQQEMQALHAKLSELERGHEAELAKERQRLQALLESAEKRAEEAAASKERELGGHRLTEEMARRELAALERDRESAQREVQRLRELVETKDVALDEASNTLELLEEKVAQFQQEMGNSAAQIFRLREIERSSKELDSRAAVDRQALESLQSNLVAEKLSVQQVRATLEKLGLDAELALGLPADEVLARVASMPEVASRVLRSGASSETTLRAQLRDLEAVTEGLQSEKARLQVHVTRLESETASLGSQQAALQLANSRLEAELEELASERQALERAHLELARDQKRLQSLHEQLNAEYEGLSQEKEALRASLRDSRNEARLLRESVERLEAGCLGLRAERDSLLAQAKSLGNLRGEHSKLKEDFRNLYTKMESVKGQYRGLQEDHRRTKLEHNQMSLRQTEAQGELQAKSEQLAGLELQIGELSQRCEMLLQLNTGLDKDRRSLMDHISVLFCQYHELFTNSLDDKEHYHMEEKMYTDKVNHLYRQKEKLEEKIMEHYRKLESCSTKKKSLGASLVRRVRKAGSGLFGRGGGGRRRSSWSANATLLSGDEEGCRQSSSFANEEDEEEEEDAEEGEQRSQQSSGEEDPLSQAHPGTRRTVYYTDDAKRPELEDSSLFQQQPGDNEQSPAEARPLLIYNKVSAVINDTTTTTALPAKDAGELEGSNDKDRKTANSVWYEYGCV